MLSTMHFDAIKKTLAIPKCRLLSKFSIWIISVITIVSLKYVISFN